MDSVRHFRTTHNQDKADGVARAMKSASRLHGLMTSLLQITCGAMVAGQIAIVVFFGMAIYGLAGGAWGDEQSMITMFAFGFAIASSIGYELAHRLLNDQLEQQDHLVAQKTWTSQGAQRAVQHARNTAILRLDGMFVVHRSLYEQDAAAEKTFLPVFLWKYM